MRIAIIGCGHVGLVTAAALASLGHDVVGTDSDQEKLDTLERGRSPFFEPGLDDLIASARADGRLSFASDPNVALAGAEVAFLCVGTPPSATGDANLAAFENAARAAVRAATGPIVLVEKSTVPVGTSPRLLAAVVRERPDLEGSLAVASNPEFLREGSAVTDALEPERILVGADSEAAFGALRAVYAPLIERGVTYIETDPVSAELAKHACNAFLALKISYANALARLCERAGGDVEAVTEVMGLDSRIGPQFLRAGLGWGGYCFPKDLQAFARLTERLGYPLPLLDEIQRLNHDAVAAVRAMIEDALWNLEGKRVALLGLTFKPGTDDVRFSPALVLARGLIEAGATVVGYDPQGLASAKAEVPELEVAADPYEACAGAHAAVLCTEWEELVTLDLPRLKEQLALPVLVDARNAYDPEAATEAGLTHYRVGRKPRTEVEP